MLLGISRGVVRFSVRSEGHTTDVEKSFCHIQIKLVVGHTIKFAEGKFDFFVAGGLHDWFPVIVFRVASFKNDFVDMLGALDGNVQ